MKISDRLLKLVSFIPKPCSVADIGTDHAYLPIHLEQNYECKKIIASDIKSGPYQAALKNVEKFGLEREIEVRLGPGLSILDPYKVETVVIAGMGGITISEILSANQQITDSINRFILQPMNASAALRDWLINNKFKIIDEDLVKERNRYYEVIVAETGEEIIHDDFILEIGPRLKEKKPESYVEFLNTKMKNWQHILNKLPDTKNQEILNKRSQLEGKIAKTQEVIRCL
ncbi:tRNA (adenine(22)-N(1))-methyltransferase [Selenihalanaerobacter shriftii]|uniref:tRNA (Adenine22-N1)-methyltransferase n=1 Tax=Selenihalanaerobacter shriftii TaxID=142842 RepID=A0A1T4MXJ2_9FIRM|nr:class I SAM-dependent methyltransferase [Selenihalanaerobacter shriftii]SJZ71779.1 tRNA (adenine22-N1)-methyltransferase [Selenihalanaerobacter shriftii]